MFQSFLTTSQTEKSETEYGQNPKLNMLLFHTPLQVSAVKPILTLPFEFFPSKNTVCVSHK